MAIGCPSSLAPETAAPIKIRPGSMKLLKDMTATTMTHSRSRDQTCEGAPLTRAPQAGQRKPATSERSHPHDRQELVGVTMTILLNDPSSATRRTGRDDCNRDAPAGFAEARGQATDSPLAILSTFSQSRTLV